MNFNLSKTYNKKPKKCEKANVTWNKTFHNSNIIIMLEFAENVRKKKSIR